MVTTRKEAKSQNLSHYFTGNPCKHGHVVKRTTNDGVCVSCAVQHSRNWQKKNPALHTLIQDKFKENNPKYESVWRKKYPESAARKSLLRRTSEQQRTPAWMTEEDKKAIKFFYECRPAGCHVDHIAPLNGESVSGLHVPQNLQWLPADVNIAKGNKY